MPAKVGKVDDDKEDNNNKHNDNKDNNNGAQNMPAIGELKSGWREDEVPAKGGEVNVDGVDAAVLLLLAQVLNPGEAVQGGCKGGSMFEQIAKQRDHVKKCISRLTSPMPTWSSCSSGAPRWSGGDADRQVSPLDQDPEERM